jgi:prephenate dehydrogenase
MDPEDHDRALAWTSHLPHLVAAALAGTLPPEWRELTASGFRDTSRVAAGDPALWTGIFAQNREAVLAALGGFREQLKRLHDVLEQSNWTALNELLAEARRNRNALGN